MKPQRAPNALAAAGRALWKRLMGEFDFENSGALELLHTACKAADRAAEARETIAKDGAIIMDRFGQRIRHPAVVIERDANGQLIQCLKLLGVHKSEPKPPTNQPRAR